MRFCTNCGTQLDDAAKFCQKCGHAVSAEAVEPAVEPANPAPEQVVEISELVAQEQVAADVTENKGFKDKAKGIFGKAIALLKKHYKIAIAVVAVVVAVIVGVSIYNSTHCSYGSCNNSVADGSSYCYTHKCNLCSSSKKYNSNYCYYHDTLYNSSSSSSSGGSTVGNATSDLKFSNIKVEHNSLYTVVTGTVTNKGTRTYKFVTVKGAFKTSSGTVVDTDSTYAVGSEGLAKGESTTFRMSVDKNTSIKSCSITITGYK